MQSILDAIHLDAIHLNAINLRQTKRHGGGNGPTSGEKGGGQGVCSTHLASSSSSNSTAAFHSLTELGICSKAFR